MGGANLPTASTPGYAQSPWGPVGCVCVIEFLEAAEQLALARGLIRESLDVVQLTGDADASAGVHSLGSAFDLRQRSPEWVQLLREMGAAYWPRTGPSWAGNEHGHGSIRCPHDARTAYQFTAYLRGYNGLGQGYYQGQKLWGYGAKDDQWRPATFRTTAQGIAWARQETDDMFTDQDRATLAQLAKLAPGQLDDADGHYIVGKLDQLRKDLAWQNTQAARVAADQAAKLSGLGAAVAQLAAGEPIDLGAIETAAQAGATAAIQQLIDHAETTTTLVAAPTE